MQTVVQLKFKKKICINEKIDGLKIWYTALDKFVQIVNLG